MKINGIAKSLTALLASLAMVTVQADAKPGKGNSGGKGHDKKGNGHWHKEGLEKGSHHANDKDKKSDVPTFARFKDSERREILDYFGRYRTQSEGLPPGLAMNQRRGKPLPPGWQKKLVPGYRIDDNEWSNYLPVPSEWFPNQRMEPNTRLYHYGDRIIRVYEPRREVIDVLVLP